MLIRLLGLAAMGNTMLAVWLVGEDCPYCRRYGFALNMVASVGWIGYAFATSSDPWPLAICNVVLFFFSLRGAARAVVEDHV